MDHDAVNQFALLHAADSLSPLPSELRKGLTALSTLGFISFITCVSLQFLLTWRLIRWTIQGKRPSQCFILIFNLVFADIQQAIAFLLNSSWLAQNGIFTESTSCWAQGWFVSTGDIASGVFCFCIGLHTFASVCFNYRLPTPYFLITLLGCWTFIYGLAVIGIAIHPDDIYVRAVAWCWMNSRYHKLRLWLHYFWIFVFEFGTVIIYLLMYATVQYRIKSNYYASNSAQAQHAKSVAKLMIVYPAVYVVCTLPLATLRMISMTTNKDIGFGYFAFAGAMITSNGWLDVLLYTLTRRIMLFSDEPAEDTYGIEDTFTLPFSGGHGRRFGTKTICEYAGDSNGGSPSLIQRVKRQTRDTNAPAKGRVDTLASFHSTDELFWRAKKTDDPVPQIPNRFATGSPCPSFNVTTRTTIEVRSDPLVEIADVREAQVMRNTGEHLSQAMYARRDSRTSSLEFATKPDGWP